MQTDIELLTAAALAVNGGAWHPLTHDTPGGRRWNPLEDDGDALRLAIALGIRVEPSPRGCSVMWPVPAGLRVETVLNSVIGADTSASARRAIVLAAAAMAGPRWQGRAAASEAAQRWS